MAVGSYDFKQLYLNACIHGLVKRGSPITSLSLEVFNPNIFTLVNDVFSGRMFRDFRNDEMKLNCKHLATFYRREND